MGSETVFSYLNRLYYGRKAGQMKSKILKAMKRNAFFPGLYIITFASNGVDQLDIIGAENLNRTYIRENLPPVAGFAVGRAEAFEVVRQMTEDAYRETGSCNLQTYLSMLH